MGVRILIGDCRERMAGLEAASVDSAVTDPPYELGFMGKSWDSTGIANDPAMWREVFRVLKPGAHLVAFSGTRTYHRMVCAIEDAGFEIRDQLAWVYGSGFPKSLDVSKAIEATETRGGSGTVAMRKAALGDDYEQYAGAGHFRDGTTRAKNAPNPKGAAFIPTTDTARQWQGWGTALKPSWEPICLARKPLVGTVAGNVLAHGTGALNVDGCRIEGAKPSVPQPAFNSPTGKIYGMKAGEGRNGEMSDNSQGRWPANILHDGSDEVLAGFPETDGAVGMRQHGSGTNSVYGKFERTDMATGFGGTKDSGSAARFFASFPIGDDEWEFARNVHAVRSAENPCGLCGTPIADGRAGTLTLDSRSEESQAGLASTGICSECIPILSRALNAGSLGSIGTTPTIPSSSKSNGSATPATAPIINLDGAARVADGSAPASATRFLYCPKATTEDRGEGNNHPTVKPHDLMRWLVRLVTPPGGTVLDPFAGSGSTLVAADAEQFDAIGCELSPDYAAIAEARVRAKAGLFADVKAA